MTCPAEPGVSWIILLQPLGSHVPAEYLTYWLSELLRLRAVTTSPLGSVLCLRGLGFVQTFTHGLGISPAQRSCCLELKRLQSSFTLNELPFAYVHVLPFLSAWIRNIVAQGTQWNTPYIMAPIAFKTMSLIHVIYHPLSVQRLDGYGR